MFFSPATIVTVWSLSSRYIFRSNVETLMYPSLMDCLFSDSTGLFVLGAESQSSPSLGVNALQSIRKIRSPDHHCIQCFDLLQWLVSMSLHNSDRCSERRCRAVDGPTNPERTSKIKKTFYLSSRISIWKARCWNISCSSLILLQYR